MKSVAVVPARGGSKRIPGKNLRPFLGVPILQRVIATLLDSTEIDEVIVSTDSPEIAQAAGDFGAVVPFIRPQELSDDYASTSAVMKHAATFIETNSISTLLYCVYPTSVGLVAEDLIDAKHKFNDGTWEYVFSATEPGASPFRSFAQDLNGGAEMLFPQYWDSRSQDLPRAFTDAALFYLADIDTWKAEVPIFTPRSTFIEIPEFRAVDINTEEDWIRAERSLEFSFRDS